jgi:hypothetical protein
MKSAQRGAFRLPAIEAELAVFAWLEAKQDKISGLREVVWVNFKPKPM